MSEPDVGSSRNLNRSDYRRSREPSDLSVDALDLADYAHTLRTRFVHPQDAYTRFPRSVASSDSAKAPSTPTHSFAPTPRSRSTTHDVDVSHFPAWSRNWYETRKKNSLPEYDLDVPLPARISIFDPTFKATDYDSLPSYGSDMFPTQLASTREYYLPWSSDPLDNGRPVDTETKEERIRMLEREFGQTAKPPPHDAFTDENGKPLVGTVDANGNLVTVGPKKRAAVRALQILLALVAAIPSIYAALFIKSTNGTPPPAGKLAAYVLYALSVVTTLCMLYLSIRPCCCGRRNRGRPTGDIPFLNGMAVLPVQRLPGGKNNNKKRKGTNNVQVNLIVDPNAFGNEDKDDEADDEDEPWDSDTPKRRRKRTRRSVFAGLAMEQEWKRARLWAKRMAAVDVFGVVLWGAAFVLILLGKRCPSGGYDGW